MIECLIIGDSIAVGIGQNRPDCHVYARVGITTKSWLKTFSYIPQKYKVAVISLSTNDFHFDNIEEHLYDVRMRANADMVIWILPNSIRKPMQFNVVKKIANELGDRVIDVSPFLGPDGIHPTASGYQTIAKKF